MRSRRSSYSAASRAGAAQLAGLLLDNLADVADDLTEGAIVVFDELRIRVRRLPVHPEDLTVAIHYSIQ